MRVLCHLSFIVKEMSGFTEFYYNSSESQTSIGTYYNKILTTLLLYICLDSFCLKIICSICRTLFHRYSFNSTWKFLD